MTERIRLMAPGVLHDQITLDDPAVLQKPVTYTLAYRRLPKYEMVEFVCDNNREYVDERRGPDEARRDRNAGGHRDACLPGRAPANRLALSER